MKIAILISGYLRSFDTTIHAFLDNFVKYYECDIYIHLTNDEDNQDEKYYNKCNFDLIRNMLKPKCIIQSDNSHHKKVDKLNNLYNQFNKFNLLNMIKNKFVEIEKINYDIVVKWRPDIYLKDRFVLKSSETDIFIPKDAKIDTKKFKKNSNNFVCDIIAYGSEINMNKYFNFSNDIEKLYEKYGCFSETMLFYYLTENNISFKKIDIEYMVILSTCNVICISGNSGSGKSKLADKLSRIHNSFILECDRYHKWERNDDNWSIITHLNPKANFLTKMRNDIFDLKIGRDIYHVNYDHESGVFTEVERIKSRDTIIVCGLHAGYNEHIPTLKIYLDTQHKLNDFWKIKRDVTERNKSMHDVVEQIKNRMDDFNSFILPQKQSADVIIRFYTDDEIHLEDIYQEYSINLQITFQSDFCIKYIMNYLNDINIQYQFKIINNNNVIVLFGKSDYYEILYDIITKISLK